MSWEKCTIISFYFLFPSFFKDTPQWAALRGVFVWTATLRRSWVRQSTVKRALCVFVGNEGRLGLEEACQHCCLSTHSVIGLLQGGGSRLSGLGLAWGHRADSWVFLVAQDQARHAFMCTPEREKQRKRVKRGARTGAAQPFSPPHLPILLSGPFLVYSLWHKQGAASLSVRGRQVKNTGYLLHLRPQWPHLPFYQSQARRCLISSPTQNTSRVIALSVETLPVATWRVYTQDCSNNMVLWQAATTIFSPLFIHLLIHWVT